MAKKATVLGYEIPGRMVTERADGKVIKAPVSILFNDLGEIVDIVERANPEWRHQPTKVVTT